MMLAGLARADAQASRSLRALPHNAVLDGVLAGLSRATDHAAGWVVLGLAGGVADPTRRGAWLRGAVAAATAHAAAELAKRAAPRARPSFPGLPPLAATPSPMSFPSAHTASAVAAAQGFDDALSPVLLGILAIVIAASRPYLGVHYASDVVAGAALGLAVGRLARLAR
jgi:membrane-associated phospholipid phosphatase